MAQAKYIPVILGSGRVGRQSEKVARAVAQILAAYDGIEVELIDVRDYTHGHTIPPWEENEITRPWREIVAKADGFLIVTPEYNHGYPGELKMLLDQELKAYVGKPVVLCGVSDGGFGGTRVVENLLPVLRELGLIASWYSIYVSDVKNFPTDPDQVDERFTEKVTKAGEQLLGMMK